MSTCCCDLKPSLLLWLSDVIFLVALISTDLGVCRLPWDSEIVFAPYPNSTVSEIKHYERIF